MYPPPHRCASGSNLINSVKMLLLHIRFQIFVLKMRLLFQRGWNLQSAAIKFNTAINMITVTCALKSFWIGDYTKRSPCV